MGNILWFLQYIKWISFQEDEIEASIHEVNQLLGEAPHTVSEGREFSQPGCSVYKKVLNVENRFVYYSFLEFLIFKNKK